MRPPLTKMFIFTFSIRPIDRCHLTILNVIPFKHERRTFTYDSPINQVLATLCIKNMCVRIHFLENINCFQIDSRLFAEVITCTAGRFLLYRFQALSLDHFDLISTTVTGIPMKVSLMVVLFFPKTFAFDEFQLNIFALGISKEFRD